MNTTTTTPKSSPVDLMIDIETMGNTPGAAILSIGAVFIKDGKLAGEFYRRIDLDSCIKSGLKMDASTVEWWLGQDDAARKSVTDTKGQGLYDVLHAFADWVKVSTTGYGELQVWGNASTFDVVLVEEAYRKSFIPVPWKFWVHRCYRTLKNCFPNVPKPEFTGIKHHALDDAKWQALHLINILEHINCLQNMSDSATKPQTDEQENPTSKSPGFVQAGPVQCRDETSNEPAPQSREGTCCPDGACDLCIPTEIQQAAVSEDPPASVPDA